MSNFGKLMQQAAAGAAGGGDFYDYTIDNSIILSTSDSEYLRRYMSTNSSTNTDKKKGVISFWFKNWRQSRTARTTLYNHMDDGYELGTMYLTNGTTELLENSLFFNDFQYNNRSSWTDSNYQLDAVIGESNRARLFRDPSAWYHLCFIWDTTQATATDRVKTYINGELQGWTHDTTVSSPRWSGSPQLPTLNEEMNYLAVGETSTSTSCRQYIGGYGHPWTPTSVTVESDLQIAEFQAIDGTAYDVSYFGEFKNGVWIPKEPSGISYGNEGSYLKFTNSSSLGTDSSGNGNNWSVISGATQSTDSPTSNHATWNPLKFRSTSLKAVLAEGNLKATFDNSSSIEYAYGTMAVTSGKWYWEHTCNAVGGEQYIGVVGANVGEGNPSDSRHYRNNGNKYLDGGSATAYGASWTTNDIMGCELDMDNGTIEFFKNGSSQGVAYTDLLTAMPDGGWAIMAGGYNNAACTIHTSSDKWTYTPSTDFVAMSTANLPEPTLGPNSNEDAADYFNTVLYTGNGTAIGSGGKSVTGVGFQPNMVWAKNRDAAQSWAWMDTQMGSGKYWTHDWTSTGVITNSESLSSMDSDGFTVGNLANVNVNAQDYVAYAFKEKAEYFDIVGYSGTGSVQNISHNLGVVPNIIIVKRVTNANTAPSYFDSGQVTDPETDYMSIFDTTIFADNNTIWNDTAPTSTQFTVGTGSGVNLSSDTFIAYLFANMDGMFKTGSYTGNGSSDGPLVYTGFRPAFILWKSISAAYGWVILDTARDTYNIADSQLYPHSNTAESSGSTYNCDILSNGFKIRNSNVVQNQSGGSYVYMAFAENPFKYANAR